MLTHIFPVLAHKYKVIFKKGMDAKVTLKEAEEGKEYTVSHIEADDEELIAFLFSLGCYSGEPITVIKHRKSGSVVAVKDGRYNIDTALAEAIAVE